MLIGRLDGLIMNEGKDWNGWRKIVIELRAGKQGVGLIILWRGAVAVVLVR